VTNLGVFSIYSRTTASIRSLERQISGPLNSGPSYARRESPLRAP
jgi:hypothetical protein